MEEWRDIPGYEGLYKVSSMGRVLSFLESPTGRLLSLAQSTNKGSKSYLNCRLTKDSKTVTKSVHRLVASAFLPNPHGYTDVNHKDEDKTNNRVENLEWMSHKENMNYGSRTKRGEDTRLTNLKNKIQHEATIIAQNILAERAKRRKRLITYKRINESRQLVFNFQ